jgi:ATP-binding cassette subfamily G (WHITE) protein 2 (SNQ2)
MTLVGIPIFFLNLVVFSILVYFSARLQQTVGQYLYVLIYSSRSGIPKARYSVYLLFLTIMSLTMQAWFRAVAAAFKSEATAQAVAGMFFDFIHISVDLCNVCRYGIVGYGHIHVRSVLSLPKPETYAVSRGYTVPKRAMVGALRWLSYINVLSYAFPGLKLN